MLQIFLGNKCNFNCPYCLQPKGLTERAELDIERIAAFIQDRSIEEVRFWGGEPLLYFDLIKEIVAGLERHNIKVRKVMVTNGSLLTSDNVAYIKDKAIFTCMSFHEEMMPESLALLAQLEFKSVNYLVSKQSLYLWDLINLKHRFDRQFKQSLTALPIYVRATPSCPSEFYLTVKEIDYHIEHLRLLSETGLGREILCVLKGHWNLIAAQYKPGYAKCMNPQHVSIDGAGNVLPCHYAQYTSKKTDYGMIPDFELIPSTQTHINSQECQECEVLPYCQGGCHLSLTPDTDCLLTKKLYDFLFKELNNASF